MKVDIIIPTYHGIYLHEALESCNKQTYKNFQIIVIDNGSILNIKKICNNFKNITYIRSDINLGPAVGRNLGISQSNSELISFLDDDDIMDQNKLMYSVQEFEKNKNIGMTCGNYRIIVNRKNIKPQFYKKTPIITLESLMRQNFVASGSVTVRRKIIEQVNCFDDRFWIAEDYDCWIKIAEISEIKYINKVLYYYSVCPGSNSLTQQAEIQKHHLENLKIIKSESIQRQKNAKNIS